LNRHLLGDHSIDHQNPSKWMLILRNETHWWRENGTTDLTKPSLIHSNGRVISTKDIQTRHRQDHKQDQLYSSTTDGEYSLRQ